MRAYIYDRFLLPLTTGWYREVLSRLPDDAVLLDVGIGTAGALLGNAALIREKRLTVVGVDIDADYIAKATAAIAAAGLQDRVTARLESVYDHVGGPYDGVYFSASFMLLPDPGAALKHLYPQLKPSGRFFFTQTFHTRTSPFLEKVKPVLKKLTTIDFGKVTYEHDFRDTVSAAGLRIDEMKTMGEKGAQSYRIVVGTPLTA